MKKWLNIKPKVFDFSEDENDTETESEDDGNEPYSDYVTFVLSFIRSSTLLHCSFISSLEGEKINVCQDHCLRVPGNQCVSRKSISGTNQ